MSQEEMAALESEHFYRVISVSKKKHICWLVKGGSQCIRNYRKTLNFKRNRYYLCPVFVVQNIRNREELDFRRCWLLLCLFRFYVPVFGETGTHFVPVCQADVLRMKITKKKNRIFSKKIPNNVCSPS